MRRIVHLSDLHFGRVDPTLIEPLLEAVHRCEPDLTALSGDFTQKGTRSEFQEAAEFVKRLPGKIIAVPGNHDMAFLNPWKRATQRLKLFREYITNDPEPWYLDNEIAVMGLNTARVTHLRDGRIREWQVKRLEERMATAAPEIIRILVTHHPFDLPAIFEADELVGRGARYMKRVVNSIDIMLAGHMHISYVGPTAMRYKVLGDSAIFVQAGTALSTRVRTEDNAFQLVRTSPGAVEVQQFLAQGDKYLPQQACLFRSVDGVWMPAAHEVQVTG
ncbi:MAG TPA: metallophosphoesterase [Bryobacteraceae bacterium]|nr:metallophosphoesterase [Bryobacteraceae bacterium]